MTGRHPFGLVLVYAIGAALTWGLVPAARGGGAVLAQSLPNPYRIVEGWAKLPDGRKMGAVGKVAVAPDGARIWAIVRCEPLYDQARFGDECRDSKTDSVYLFDAAGTVVRSFGGGMFIWPHGLAIDPDGNVWVTDAVAENRTPKGDTRGQVVVKFSPSGKVLMTLGTSGQPGSGPDHFTSPSDVAVAANGDIFVADGHNDVGNNRVVRFSTDGKFIKAWGKSGWAPGEFHALHAIAIDSRGRIFVGDRGNNRIQIFDQDGKSLTTPWTQFGKPSGIVFDSKDQIYVADSESDDVQNPGWEEGIRIGDAKTGWMNAFILYPWGDPRQTAGDGAEFVAVDRDGNIYAGEPRPKRLQKYVRVRP
jgi:DNA-binding beta-propeller fold protein YncE